MSCNCQSRYNSLNRLFNHGPQVQNINRKGESDVNLLKPQVRSASQLATNRDPPYCGLSANHKLHLEREKDTNQINLPSLSKLPTLHLVLFFQTYFSSHSNHSALFILHSPILKLYSLYLLKKISSIKVQLISYATTMIIILA